MISVIIPAYNSAEYIGRTLMSITNQTYKDIEIIVVNDGSTDSTAEVVSSFMSTDARIKLFNIPNGGAFAARLYGIRKALGNWITFSDSDDTMPEEALSRLVELTRDSRDIVVGTLNLNNKQIFHHSITGEITGKEYCEGILLGQTSIGNYGKLYKPELFEELQPVPSNIRHNEDMLMLLHAAKNAQSVFISNDCVVYNYLYRPESISKGTVMPLKDWLELFNHISCTLSTVLPSIRNAFSLMRLRRLYEKVVLVGSVIDPSDKDIQSIIRECEQISSLSGPDSKYLRIIKSISLQKQAYAHHMRKIGVKRFIKKCLGMDQ